MSYIPLGYCQCGCGNKTGVFDRNHSKYGWVKGQFKRYIYGHKKSKPIAERFWFWVKTGNPDDYWEWQGCRNERGYGWFRLDRHSGHTPSHRFSYELNVGVIPDGLLVLHKCDNPPCVNPKHLFIGTQADNIHDMDNKKRRNPNVPKGTKCHFSKLSEDNVINIRKLLETVPMTKIARLFGVSYEAITAIKYRKSWKHIG